MRFRKMEGAEIASSGAGPDAEWSAIQMKEKWENALQALPEEYRRVYQMRDLENQPGEKVAAELGISLGAMKSRLHRARTLLREKLDAVLRGNCDSVEGARRWKSP